MGLVYFLRYLSIIKIFPFASDHVRVGTDQEDFSRTVVKHNEKNTSQSNIISRYFRLGITTFLEKQCSFML